MFATFVGKYVWASMKTLRDATYISVFLSTVSDENRLATVRLTQLYMPK